MHLGYSPQQPEEPLRGDVTVQKAIAEYGTFKEINGIVAAFTDMHPEIDFLKIRATGLFLILQNSRLLSIASVQFGIQNLSNQEKLAYFQQLPESTIEQIATDFGLSYIDCIQPETVLEAMALLDTKKVLPQIAKQLKEESLQTQEALAAAKQTQAVNAAIREILEDGTTDWETIITNALQILKDQAPHRLNELMQATHVDFITLRAYNAYYLLERKDKIKAYQSATDYTPAESNSGIVQAANDTAAKFSTIHSLVNLEISGDLDEIMMLLGENPAELDAMENNLSSLAHIAKNSGRQYYFARQLVKILEDLEAESAAN